MAASLHHINKLSKKPGLWATRAIEETGFLAASLHHNQQLSKKPGFWATRAISFDAKIENSS